MNINLYLSEKEDAERSLGQQLRQEAKRQRRSLSFIVREAISKYLQLVTPK